MAVTTNIKNNTLTTFCLLKQYNNTLSIDILNIFLLPVNAYPLLNNPVDCLHLNTFAVWLAYIFHGGRQEHNIMTLNISYSNNLPVAVVC